MKFIILLAIFLGSLLANLNASTFSAAQGKLDGDIEKSLSDLAEVQSSVAEEKIPLSRKVSELENSVITKRREYERLLKIRDSRTIDLSSLEKQVKSLQEQNEFMRSMMNDFVRDFEGRLDLSELPKYEKATSDAKLSLSNSDLSEDEKVKAQLSVLKLALGRLGEKIGGDIYGGEALSANGDIVAGKFIGTGPSVYFASDDGNVSGLTEHQLNAAVPVIISLPENVSSELVGIAQTGKGMLPVDGSLGKALKVVKAKKTIADYIEDGGTVGYVILGLGGFSLLLILFKFFEIIGFRVCSNKQIESILGGLQSGDKNAAFAVAEKIRGECGEMLRVGVEHFQEKRGILEELLFEKILKVRPRLERLLPFLAITAAAAPLLGLLGTVIGMIKTFHLITVFGTGDAKSLSSGISEALITTALGLIVAIPVLILHGMLMRMAKQKLGVMEQSAVAFVNGTATLKHKGSEKTPPNHSDKKKNGSNRIPEEQQVEKASTAKRDNENDLEPVLA